jgi:hypothetical protein
MGKQMVNFHLEFAGQNCAIATPTLTLLEHDRDIYLAENTRILRSDRLECNKNVRLYICYNSPYLGSEIGASVNKVMCCSRTAKDEGMSQHISCVYNTTA